MALHVIEPERGTVHGAFSRELAPIRTIDPGDIVRFRTLEAGWSVAPPEGRPEDAPKFAHRDPERDRGHALCGPIGVRGARAGMVLAVHVAALRVGTWGWTVAGGWDGPLNRRLGVAEGEGTFLRWTLDPDTQTGWDQRGHRIALRPFMGVMGMPPAAPGWHATAPPRSCGGNLDCKELVVGSTLYLPIPVDGALFSVGDGHAVQGDGEVATTALECPMERVELRFDLVPERSLAMPRADTPAGWLTFGVHPDLGEAAHLAVDGMLQLMGERYGMPRREALALASLLVDLRVTQICNGVVGVHAMLPHGALR